MGPESTGKTELARSLSEYFSVPWIPEYARDYLERRGGVCRPDDIPRIAWGQALLEFQVRKERPAILISDTDLFSTVVWSEYYFGVCPPGILETAVRLKGSLYLLTDIDIPWVPDGLRDGPDTRHELRRRFVQIALGKRLPFVWVRGTGSMRRENAIRAIENELQKQGKPNRA
jgi:nicotinamide riboside kinase